MNYFEPDSVAGLYDSSLKDNKGNAYHIHQLLRTFKVKIYLNASHTRSRYLLVLRTDNENVSRKITYILIIPLPLVSMYNMFCSLPARSITFDNSIYIIIENVMEVRGFIVLAKSRKESKQRFIIQRRLYSTSSKAKILSQVSGKKTKKTLSKDFESLAKH